MFFTVIVRTEAATEKTKIASHRGSAFGFRLKRPPRIADGLLEPAIGSGTDAGKDSPMLECSTKDKVKSVFPPKDDQVSAVAASDIDDIGFDQSRGEVIGRYAKQRE